MNWQRELAGGSPGVARVRQTSPVVLRWGAAPDPGIFGGMTEQKNEPDSTKDPVAHGPAGSCGAILPLRSGYPSAGCVPAEPASVSPDSALYLTIPERFKTSTSASRLSGFKTSTSDSRLGRAKTGTSDSRLPHCHLRCFEALPLTSLV